MKLTMQREPFAAALNAAVRVLPSKAHTPILESLLLQAGNGTLTVTGTDLERRLSIEAEAEVVEPGAICLPGSGMAGWVGAMTTGALSLSTAPNRRATLVAGKARSLLAGHDPEDFPPVALMSEAEPVALPAGSLKAALGRVIHAACPPSDTSRPVLNAVLFRTDGERLTLAAADGYRLAVAYFPSEARFDAFLVPVSAAADLARLLPEGEDETAVEAWPGSVLTVRFGRMMFQTRLIAGVYPDLDRIVPAECATTTTVEAVELLAALRAAGAVAERLGDDGRYTLVLLSFGDGGPLRLEARDGDGDGEHEQEFEAESNGPELCVGLQAKYLAQALDALGAKRVTFSGNGPEQPIVLRGVGDATGGYEVLMPMHVAVRDARAVWRCDAGSTT